jgi:hypothetical protein
VDAKKLYYTKTDNLEKGIEVLYLKKSVAFWNNLKATLFLIFYTTGMTLILKRIKNTISIQKKVFKRGKLKIKENKLII